MLREVIIFKKANVPLGGIDENFDVYLHCLEMAYFAGTAFYRYGNKSVLSSGHVHTSMCGTGTEYSR